MMFSTDCFRHLLWAFVAVMVGTATLGGGLVAWHAIDPAAFKPSPRQPGDHVYLISEGKIAAHYQLECQRRVRLRGEALLSSPSGRIIEFTSLQGEFVEWSGQYLVVSVPLDVKVGDAYPPPEKK